MVFASRRRARLAPGHDVPRPRHAVTTTPTVPRHRRTGWPGFAPWLRRSGRAVIGTALLLGGLATSVDLAVAGTPGHDPANGSWVGGLVLDPGPEPLVLWQLPGSNGRLGTCITAGGNGPLHGTYRYTSTITDAVYAELNHLYAQPGTPDMRLAELSALNSAKYDRVDKKVQWSYVVNGQGGTSVADADAMLARAGELAGPYTVSVDWPAADNRAGHPYTATVTVRSATGHPVPQARVSLTATNATLAAGSASTDAGGRAAVGFTITPGTSSTVTIHASVQSWTTLQTWSAAGQQTMLVAGAPSTQAGQHTGSVLRTRVVRLVKAAADDPRSTPVAGYVYEISDDHGRVVAPAVTTGLTPGSASAGELLVGGRYRAREVKVPPGAKLYIPTDATLSFTVPAGVEPWTFVATDPAVPRPAVTTHVSAEVATVGQQLADTVDIWGNDGEDGFITATLHGPVVVPSGRCTDVTLAQFEAAPSHAITVAVLGSRDHGNGSYLVHGPPAAAPGCWGWSEELRLTPSGATATSPPTAPHESTLVTRPHTPPAQVPPAPTPPAGTPPPSAPPLSRTGTSTAPQLAVGVTAFGAGVLVLVAGRRRRQS